MRPLFSLFRIANRTNRVSGSPLNFTPKRGARYDSKIVWREPQKYKNYHPVRTGDTMSFNIESLDDVFYRFRSIKKSIESDEKLKKVFSLKYQEPDVVYRHYQHELVEKVKEHPLDDSSYCVRIAKKTATIRYFQKLLSAPANPSLKGYRRSMEQLIGSRNILLRKLRAEDYKKFEWLLEVLELKFRPGIHKDCRKLNRRKEILKLAHLKVEKSKQEKLAELRKSLDEQKVPFFQKKLGELKEIKEKEEKLGLEPTITEEDIKECMEQLEKVKIQVEENAAIGYLKKVHPFLLEAYNEKLLLQKEKSGELLRDKLTPKQPKKFSEDTSS